MATVKIVLRKKANKDGTYPLTIRITKDRRTSFIHLGKHLNENQWDSAAQRVKKSHPNSARLNNYGNYICVGTKVKKERGIN